MVHLVEVLRVLRIFEGQAHAGLHLRKFRLHLGQLALNLVQAYRLFFHLA